MGPGVRVATGSLHQRLFFSHGVEVDPASRTSCRLSAVRYNDKRCRRRDTFVNFALGALERPWAGDQTGRTSGSVGTSTREECDAYEDQLAMGASGPGCAGCR